MKQNTNLLIAFLLCTAFCFSACRFNLNGEDLTGVAPEDTVFVADTLMLNKPFTAIETNGAFDITIVQGDSITALYEGRKVYLDNMEKEIKDSTLRFSSKEERFARGHLTITMPKVENIHVSGSSNIVVDSLTQESTNFFVTIHGAGDVNVSKTKANKVFIAISGAGQLNINDIKSSSFIVIVSGSGDGNILNVDTDSIIANVSGAGDLNITGKTHAIDKRVSGAGDINTSGLTLIPQEQK